MSEFVSNIRYCLFNTKGEPLSLELRVNNALIAHALVELYDKVNGKWILRKNWELKVDNNSSEIILMDEPLETLNGTGMQITINCCSNISTIRNGNVEFRILQGNVSCVLTKPMIWPLADIPVCATGNFFSIKTTLILLEVTL